MSGVFNFLNLKLAGNSLLLFFLTLLAIIVLRELFLYQSRRRPVFYYGFLFPGIIIHELAHTLLCLTTFTKIHSIKLFSKDGGFVLHQKPKFLLISFLISIAPLLAGIAIIYFAIIYYGFSSASVVQMFSAKAFIVLYFLSSILLTMLPSRQDVFNAFSVYIALALAVFLYYYLSNNNHFFDRANYLLLFSLILLVILNIVILIINRLWKSK